MKTADYAQTKDEQNEQSYAFAANAILETVDNQGGNTLALTSSNTNKEGQWAVAANIADKLRSHCRVLLIYVTPQGDGEIAVKDGVAKADNPSPEKLGAFLKEKKETADILLLCLPPVRLYAQALEYAKMADKLYLVERTCHSTYGGFEKTLGLLSTYDIHPAGTILYR